MSKKRGKQGKAQQRKTAAAANARRNTATTPGAAAAEGIADLLARAQPSALTDPRTLTAGMSNDEYSQGHSREQNSTVVRVDNALLMDRVDTVIIDTVHNGDPAGRRMFLQLAGRVNKTQDRATVGAMFDTDGAAIIIMELLALADRAGGPMLQDLVEQMVALQHGNHASLRTLRACLDTAIGDSELHDHILR